MCLCECVYHLFACALCGVFTFRRWALNNYDVQLTNADWLKEMLSIPDMKFNRSLESFKTLYRLLGTSLLGCQVRGVATRLSWHTPHWPFLCIYFSHIPLG
jgi:hypothetical protein